MTNRGCTRTVSMAARGSVHEQGGPESRSPRSGSRGTVVCDKPEPRMAPKASSVVALAGGPPPSKSRLQRFVGRAVRAKCLLAGASPASRVKLGGYLAWDLLHHVLGVPAKSFEMNLVLSGFRVTVRAFSSQLGAYTDIFHLAEYERVPGFQATKGE